MYKSGKHWIYAVITTIAGVFGGTAFTNNVQATSEVQTDKMVEADVDQVLATQERVKIPASPENHADSAASNETAYSINDTTSSSERISEAESNTESTLGSESNNEQSSTAVSESQTEMNSGSSLYYSESLSAGNSSADSDGRSTLDESYLNSIHESSNISQSETFQELEPSHSASESMSISGSEHLSNSTSNSLMMSVSNSKLPTESNTESTSEDIVSTYDSVSISHSSSELKSQSQLKEAAISQSENIKVSVSESSSESQSLPDSTFISQSLRYSTTASLSDSASTSRSQLYSTRESTSDSASTSQSQLYGTRESLSDSASTSQSERKSQLDNISESVSNSQSARVSQLNSLSDSVSTSQSERYDSLSAVSNSTSTSLSERTSQTASLSRSASDSVWNRENNNADDYLIRGDHLDDLGGTGYLFDKETGYMLSSFTDWFYTSPYFMYNKDEGYVKVPLIDPKKNFVTKWSYSFGEVTYKGKTYHAGDRIYDEAFKEGNFEGLKFLFIPEEVTVKYSYQLKMSENFTQEDIDQFNQALEKANLLQTEIMMPGDIVNPVIEIPGYKAVSKIIPTNIFPMPYPIDWGVSANGTGSPNWVSYEYVPIDQLELNP